MTVQAMQTIEFKDFSKGMNTYDSDTGLSPGYYADAQNMVLTNKNPKTIAGTTRLTVTPAPNSGNIVWCEPYTFGSPAVTTLFVASIETVGWPGQTGLLYKYDVATDTWTTLRLGTSGTAVIWTHVPFRGTLFIANGVDPIFKYNGTNVLPVGAVLVADMEADESWAGGGTFVTGDTARRTEGLRSLKIVSGQNHILTYAAATDFQAGINGAPNFGTADKFKIDIYRETADANGNTEIRFRDFTNPAIYFTATITTTAAGWNTYTVLRSAFALVGAAVWTNIGSLYIAATSGVAFHYDNAFQIYNLAPPIGGLIDLYNQQLMVAGIASDLVAMQYSDAGTPDYFPAANIARFSGGRNALEKTDQITALRSYFDELIVGKVNSAWTFSGTGTNVSISALPLTLGIDSHRGIVETPWALHYIFENNVFGSRLTSRGLVSTNISSLFQNMEGTRLENTVAIRSDRTHIIRWAFQSTSQAGTANDIGLLYDYIADAWLCKYTQLVRYYTRATVNGNREIIGVQYDGYVRRFDVGTAFDGTAIASYITLPWMQAETPDKHGNVVRWMNGTAYLRGTASVLIQARFADDPTEMNSASFSTLATVTTSPDGDKGYFDIGQTSRWIQLKFSASALSFEILPPVIIGYNDTQRRV